MLQQFRFGLIVCFAAITAACATPGSDLTASVNSIRTGLASAETETGAVFALANKQARDDTIRHLVLSSKGPSEKAFASVIADETSEQWTSAFDALDSYLGGIQSLVTSDAPESVTNDLITIGDTLQSDTIGAKLPPGSAGLFANLGGSLLQATAEADAQRIMQQTDPAFYQLTQGMANLIYPPTEDARRGTIYNLVQRHWGDQLIEIEREYRKVANGAATQREAVLKKYGATIDLRDAELQRLRRLRQALLALGEAHHEASQGNSSGILFWLGQLETQLDAARNEAKGAR